MHPRLSLHPLAAADQTLEEDLALCERLGLRRLSLSMHKLAGRDLGAALDRVQRSGLAIDFVIPSQPGFMLAEPGGWPATAACLIAAMDVAAAVGARAVFTTGGSGQGMAYEDAAAAFARAIDPLIGELGRRNLRLFLEPVRTQFAHAGFVHSFSDAVGVARSLGIEIAFDVAHCWWEPGLVALLRRERGLIGTIQLADLDFSGPITARVNLGDGHLPIGSLLEAAVAPDYEGSFDLELIGPAILAEGVGTAIRRAGEYLADMLPSA